MLLASDIVSEAIRVGPNVVVGLDTQNMELRSPIALRIRLVVAI